MMQYAFLVPDLYSSISCWWHKMCIEIISMPFILILPVAFLQFGLFEDLHLNFSYRILFFFLKGFGEDGNRTIHEQSAAQS